MADEMNGARPDEVSAELEHAVEMVGIEVIPIGPDGDTCQGAAIRLTKDAAEGEAELALTCAMSPPQCREIARRLLVIADAASSGAQRTILCVTATTMWKLPGQMMMVRFSPDPHYEFLVNPAAPKKLVKSPTPKLIVPGR